MVGEASTDANLRDYEEQLNALDSNDIRVPNQSLILDYFCTDHELTDFLRDEVFLESSIRHTTWRKVNQRVGDESKRIIDDEILFLLDSENKLSSRVWKDIVKLTASRQARQEIVEYINRASSYEQSSSAGYEQWSIDPVIKCREQTGANTTGSIRSKTGTQTLSNANSRPQIKQTNKDSASVRTADSRLPMLVGSLALLGLLGIAVSTTNYETASTSVENTSSIPTVSDNSMAVQKLSELEAEQKGAVLMCEHQFIIDKAKYLSLVEPQNSRRRDALIASSNKEIAYLNQKSTKGDEYKYWEDETCTWGMQWFDNHANNQFRLFLAVSKKCSTPMVHYKYTKDPEGRVLLSRGKYNAYGHTKGEVRLPYLPEQATIFVENVTCS